MDLSHLGEAALKGAAAGSIVPGVGSALGAAGGIALDLAPDLGKWLFGPGAGSTIAAVHEAVASVTGSTSEPEQVEALSDPDLAGQLRLRLAEIAAERTAAECKAAQDRLVAELSDLANARATTVQLASAGSPMAWGAAIVSALVLLTFGGVMAMALSRALPEHAEPVLNVLLGTLSAMATSVVSYWVGSSVGSARKDDRLASILNTRPSAQ